MLYFNYHGSPDFIEQLLEREPVVRTSPASSIITCEIQLMRESIENDISFVLPSCTTCPFKVVTILKLVRFILVTINEPKGPKVSNPFPLVNWGSDLVFILI